MDNTHKCDYCKTEVKRRVFCKPSHKVLFYRKEGVIPKITKESNVIEKITEIESTGEAEKNKIGLRTVGKKIRSGGGKKCDSCVRLKMGFCGH